MGGNDGTTQSEPEPHAAVVAGRARSSVVPLEYPLLFPRWNPGSPVSYLDDDVIVLRKDRDLDRRPLRGMADDVLDEIDDDLFDQDRIERGQRNLFRRVGPDGTNAELPFEMTQRSADRLVDGLRSWLGVQAARFESRQLEQMTHQAIEARSLRGYDTRELATLGGVEIALV